MRIMSQVEVQIVYKHKQQGKPVSNQFKADNNVIIIIQFIYSWLKK